MKYFAYGSNMLEERICNRVKNTVYIANGSINGWELKFNKKSNDNSGKCNIHYTGLHTNIIHGIVFDIPDESKPILDRDEAGYISKVMKVMAINLNDFIDCLVYIANPLRIENKLKPYNWYLDLVIAGAKQHKLPEDYILNLQSVISLVDEQDDRKTKIEAEKVLEIYRKTNHKI